MTSKKQKAALVRARAARNEDWSLKQHLIEHEKFEADRIAALISDQLVNPDAYCQRTAPLPADGVCTRCQVSNTLVMERLDHFVVFTCQVCGTDYFPHVEPILKSEASSSAGRHHSANPGEHYNDYDSTYRKTKKGKKNATT